MAKQLSKQELLEQEALKRWMKQRGFDIGGLASAVGDSYANVFVMLTDRRVNDAFKWRFAQAFGWQEADSVFGVAREPVEA